MITELAYSAGHGFLPESVMDFMGQWTRAAARLKTQPKFFRVEEQSTADMRCTTEAESDIGNGRLFGSGSDSGGDKIALTMVKKCHTTPTGIDRLIAAVTDPTSGRKVRATYAGLKDRWAITSQRVVLEGARWEDVVRACMPDAQQLDEVGIFFKDPVRTHKHLSRGHLIGNNFIIKVMVAGMSASQLEEYVAPRVAHLTRGGRIIIPNAFGRQRLGKRQNLFGVGHDFIVHGPEVGIKRFLTETSPNESPWAAEVRGKLLAEWEAAEVKAAANGNTVAQQIMHLQGMREILEQGGPDRAPFKKLNMTIEHRIVCQLLKTLDYEKTLRALYEDFSLWTGAYQGYWFNQVLAAALTGEITLDNQDDPEARIPLYMDEQRSLRFYRRFAPEAVQTQIDPLVRELFLTPQHKHDRGPRRPLFVPVGGLCYDCEDGAVNMGFSLPKGAYATTFLGILFAVEGDQEAPPTALLKE
ncbi:MAG: tRNA pseudouridine(13) synthase TruD [Candidatus Melainabacteria bacterium]|nr:tRNA pseudouridine(13) synthase TruD [Candidatus Melainabacteria bacterium]